MTKWTWNYALRKALTRSRMIFRLLRASFSASLVERPRSFVNMTGRKKVFIQFFLLLSFVNSSSSGCGACLVTTPLNIITRMREALLRNFSRNLCLSWSRRESNEENFIRHILSRLLYGRSYFSGIGFRLIYLSKRTLLANDFKRSEFPWKLRFIIGQLARTN